ncbi:MAG: patatin-like phospholipase family protein [Proteobacteria bacterium]|nr:patatin-like phospholipase family protein [Pseudomonadota bacterium]
MTRPSRKKLARAALNQVEAIVRTPAVPDKPAREKRGGRAAAPGPKRLNLALQGGGSHGAFTWGVLDRLLEDDRLIIEAISGTSAGAMNAAVMAAGYADSGRAGAREALATFWHRVAEAGRYGPIQRMPWDKLTHNYRLDHTPSYIMLDMMSRLFSPYQLNPTNAHPLRDILAESIDLEKLRQPGGIRLFICATNVRTGKIKVFENAELSIDALLASACLPFMFQAVEIGGEHYYDGGYMGNPPLYPLIYKGSSHDVIIVQINPLIRKEIPTSAREIMDRVNEISFNASLMREMRAVYFVTSLIDSGQLDANKHHRMYVHMIENEDKLRELHASSKLNADPEFLEYLRDLGRDSTERWLATHYDQLAVESSVDLAATFM